MPGFDEVVADALTTVRLVPRWELGPDEWPLVREGLARLQGAVAAGDARGVRQALEDIERHGPTRLAAISRTPEERQRRQPPREVLDIVNTLIHPSGSWVGGSRP